MNKPSIADLLLASGYTVFVGPPLTRAINALYGDVGANLDERNWAAIMASPNPLAAAESALHVQWQDASYLLRNAQHVLGIGYPDFAPEFTYRQMGQRLGYTYSPAWSEGSAFASISQLSNESLNGMAAAYREAPTPPTFSFNASNTNASVTLSHGGRLAWSVSGATTNEGAGTLALTPTGPGGTVREGLLTLTRDSGDSVTSSVYVVVGSDSALTRNFNAGGVIADRLIVLGAGHDDIRAGSGNDTVYGGDGDDSILGNQGNDRIYAGNGNDALQGGQGADVVDGGPGDDLVSGGTTGADSLTGGTGADQFRFSITNSAVVVNDFSLADGDRLAFEDGDGTTASGSVAFAANATNAGVALLAADFDAVASLAGVRSDTGGAGAGNSQIYVITSSQSTAQLQAEVPAGALNAYVVAYNSTDGVAKVYFDTNWSTAADRTEVATLTGLSAAALQGLTMANFVLWSL